MTSMVDDNMEVIGEGYCGVECDAKKIGGGDRADGLAVWCDVPIRDISGRALEQEF